MYLNPRGNVQYQGSSHTIGIEIIHLLDLTPTLSLLQVQIFKLENYLLA